MSGLLMPKAPKAPPPPAPPPPAPSYDNAEAAAQNSLDILRRRKGQASTVLAGGDVISAATSTSQASRLLGS
jgi:hypothetical protein